MSLSSRLRSLAWFAAAAIYYVLAQQVSFRAASGLSSGDWLDFIQRCILLFLLIVGFAVMGYAGQRQRQPVKAMGLDRRPGWRREFALGAAIGWGGVVACVLPVALVGGLVVTLFTTWHQFGMILLDLAILAVAALLEEVAFRGYPFQRLIDAIGPGFATVLMCVIFGVAHLRNPDSTGASTLVTVLAGWLLAVAYLRTRALWVGWGIHFAWNATMGILFGLPVSGINNFSPVILSNANGPVWLTGDGYGPEGSLLAAIVMLVLLVRDPESHPRSEAPLRSADHRSRWYSGRHRRGRPPPARSRHELSGGSDAAAGSNPSGVRTAFAASPDYRAERRRR